MDPIGTVRSHLPSGDKQSKILYKYKYGVKKIYFKVTFKDRIFFFRKTKMIITPQIIRLDDFDTIFGHCLFFMFICVKMFSIICVLFRRFVFYQKLQKIAQKTIYPNDSIQDRIFFLKTKNAHNSLNDRVRRLLTPFLVIDFFNVSEYKNLFRAILFCHFAAYFDDLFFTSQLQK